MVTSSTDNRSLINRLPDKNQLRIQYEEYRAIFLLILTEIEAKLKDILILPSSPTYKTRIKTFNSYYRKVMRVRPLQTENSGIPVLTDILGIRVIATFLEDLTSIEKQITEHFDVEEIEHKGAERTFKEFGYESTHILIKIDAAILEKYALPADMVCEIQVRTILQDAWAEVEHELVYRAEFSPFDLPLKRKLASMNACLSLADIIFQEIRAYQTKLNKELEQRRDTFFDQADHISKQQLPDVFTDDIPPLNEMDSSSPYVQGTIDDLLLEAIHAHNIGELDRAIAIYTQIIMAKPNPIARSVMYNHRAKAYFAQGEYENALTDFAASIEQNPDNFRSYYFAGIVCSTVGDEKRAIEYYNQSLERSSCQPYIYYRKALSLYHVGEYAQSLSNLDMGVSFGLANRDEKKLRLKLTEKIGII